MPLYRWEIIRRRKPLITRKLHDVSQVLYLPFDKNHEPYSVESYDPTQVLRLPLEDPPQEITRDRSGYGNDGTIYGAARVIGKVRNALKFDGVDDYVDCGKTSSLALTSSGTIVAWAKYDTLDGILVSSMDWDTERYGYILLVHADGSITFAIGDDVGRDRLDTPAGVISTGTWYHIVGTWDGANLKVYVDGSLVKTAPQTRNSVQNYNTYIGSNVFGVDLRWMDGIIDEVRIYNRALSQAEIKRLMNLRGV